MGSSLSAEEVLQKSYQPIEKGLNILMRNYPYTIHPYGRGTLTTAGTKYTTNSRISTAATTKTTGYKAHFQTTISWPGFSTDTQFIDEVEFGLTLNPDTTSTAIQSSFGYRFEWKDQAESTWQALSTWRTVKTSAADTVERTLSGYAGTGVGYRKVPFNLRLRTYNKVARNITLKLRNSSYIVIIPRRSA